MMFESLNLILAAELFGGMKGIMIIVLPLVGSVMLAYGVFSVVVDLRSSDRKRVVRRLQGDAAGKPKASNVSSVSPRSCKSCWSRPMCEWWPLSFS